MCAGRVNGHTVWASRSQFAQQGRAANVTGTLRAPDPAQPPSPAAKLNTRLSETALLIHRHTGLTAAENTLQKINRAGAQEEQIFDQSEKDEEKEDECVRALEEVEEERRDGGMYGDESWSHCIYHAYCKWLSNCSSK